MVIFFVPRERLALKMKKDFSKMSLSPTNMGIFGHWFSASLKIFLVG